MKRSESSYPSPEKPGHTIPIPHPTNSLPVRLASRVLIRARSRPRTPAPRGSSKMPAG
jgi:hypothetical protein